MATRLDSTIEVTGQPAIEEHVVIFRLADEYYALDIQTVQEIVRMQAITSIPGSDFWVEGITNLRGRVVPVVDLRKRALTRLEGLYNEVSDPGHPIHVGIIHANALSDAEALAKAIQAIREPDSQLITQISAVISVHTGPGAVGFSILQ